MKLHQKGLSSLCCIFQTFTAISSVDKSIPFSSNLCYRVVNILVKVVTTKFVVLAADNTSKTLPPNLADDTPKFSSPRVDYWKIFLLVVLVQTGKQRAGCSWFYTSYFKTSDFTQRLGCLTLSITA